MASTIGGTVRPSALAVARFMGKIELGRLLDRKVVGLASRRILPAQSAARRIPRSAGNPLAGADLDAGARGRRALSGVQRKRYTDFEFFSY